MADDSIAESDMRAVWRLLAAVAAHCPAVGEHMLAAWSEEVT